ncbi:3-5-cyclic-nucleotide phosphodiesterase [Venturia nashicola]|uniref:3-5-cyclic-nucleotide phosphodiesterase n=1 Tax=Venturia nashicola TaxID=86259 RepID=A0A4Z1NW48_9PEZI|nr:3-5-cyclic-nucleotide phosphodiesterase [Venturia nashicola]
MLTSVQGSGGGPSEDNITGFLVRSTASDWSKGSILAVDAGSHLASIVRILEDHFPLISPDPHPSCIDSRRAPPPNDDAVSPTNSQSSFSNSERSPTPPAPPATVLEAGPFAGLAFPHASARANAVHIVREHVSTYLITHPHLDHLSGFAMNTAAFHNTSRPKRLAALPFTVLAIKNHIFNDIIWPNLTDEDNGVGLVTFQRLTEGGNLALGEGTSRGFIEVCDGLAVKGFKISHGKCAGAPRGEHGHQSGRKGSSGGPTAHSHGHTTSQNTPGGENARRSSVFSQGAASQPGTPQEYAHPVVDSTAYFIRDDATGKELLMFGDVEADSLSLCPRNHIVWAEAAYKISHGLLSGIFIECSYNDSQKDEYLFGHLAPRHLVAELQTLAEMVEARKKDMNEKAGRKRKRTHGHLHGSGAGSHGHEDSGRRSRSRTQQTYETMQDLIPEEEEGVPMTPTPMPTTIPATMSQEPTSLNLSADGAFASAQIIPYPPEAASAASSVSTMAHPQFIDTPDSQVPSDGPGPLKGVKVIIVHVKDSMADGPPVSVSILKELYAHEARLSTQGRALGCEYVISKGGESYWF